LKTEVTGPARDHAWSRAVFMFTMSYTPRAGVLGGVFVDMSFMHGFGL
jgi:hypothetical protein